MGWRGGQGTLRPSPLYQWLFITTRIRLCSLHPSHPDPLSSFPLPHSTQRSSGSSDPAPQAEATRPGGCFSPLSVAAMQRAPAPA